MSFMSSGQFGKPAPMPTKMPATGGTAGKPAPMPTKMPATGGIAGKPAPMPSKMPTKPAQKFQPKVFGR
jgi:hypothetical protein